MLATVNYKEQKATTGTPLPAVAPTGATLGVSIFAKMDITLKPRLSNSPQKSNIFDRIDIKMGASAVVLPRFSKSSSAADKVPGEAPSKKKVPSQKATDEALPETKSHSSQKKLQAQGDVPAQSKTAPANSSNVLASLATDKADLDILMSCAEAAPNTTKKKKSKQKKAKKSDKEPGSAAGKKDKSKPKEEQKSDKKPGSTSGKKKSKPKKAKKIEKPKEADGKVHAGTRSIGGGWTLITKTRGPKDKMWGQSYNEFLSPEGIVYRSIKKAMEKGNFDKKYLKTKPKGDADKVKAESATTVSAEDVLKGGVPKLEYDSVPEGGTWDSW